MRFLMRVGDEAIWPPGHGGQYPEYKQAVPIPSSPVPSCNIKYNTTVGEIGRICVVGATPLDLRPLFERFCEEAVGPAVAAALTAAMKNGAWG